MVSSFSSNYSDLQNTADPVLQDDSLRKWSLQCRPSIRGGAIVNWLRLVWGSMRHADSLRGCQCVVERLREFSNLSSSTKAWLIDWLHVWGGRVVHIYTRRPQDQMCHGIGVIPGTYKSFYHFLRIFPTWQILYTWLAKIIEISSRDWLVIVGSFCDWLGCVARDGQLSLRHQKAGPGWPHLLPLQAWLWKKMSW
jgi:hypothetical protein